MSSAIRVPYCQVGDVKDISADTVKDDIGLEVWQSSHILCDYVMHSQPVKELILSAVDILELGAGLFTILDARRALAQRKKILQASRNP